MKKFINTASKVFWILYIAYCIFMLVAFIAGCIKAKKDKRMQAEDKEEEMARNEFDEEFEMDIKEVKNPRENISSDYPKRKKTIFDDLDERLKKNREEMRDAFKKAGWDKEE